ncbi:hypothetical protein BK120_19445 [Paenibacillus sp. FSL A5-0031]|uniref:hypothetical protein n=1 Tax=unclassified Paenibacillus TaxID=185978 RepID=UPI00096DA3D7|nr:hypothetical protein [Paenibacillus sp. FSL A5-0031]OME80020.1 hypothetical protein BK120_19445 [Paenibacillus sp. FSL A5-0031]
MFGTWRWNVVFGIFGTVLTVAFSIGNNPITVMLLRSMYAFIAFFVLAYGVRAILAYILQPPALIGSEIEDEEGKGSQLDLQTPDESEDINQLLKSQIKDGAGKQPIETQKDDASDFRPLNPPQLLNTKNTQPEELVKAIRHLTGE